MKVFRSRSDESRIESEATAWVARRDAGLDAAAQRELAMWLAADARHADALARFDSAWSALDRPRNAGTVDLVLQGLARAARRRRQVRMAWTGAAVAGLAVAAGWWRYEDPRTLAATPVVASLSSEQRLPDGSLVEFNRGAEIALDFKPDARRVRLIRGEAHFQVTHDAARPFIVSAGQVEVKAVGTAFAVRFGPQDVEVLVTEGRVNVVDSAAPASTTATSLVAVGQRIAVPLSTGAVPARAEEMTDSDYNQGLGWRGNRLDFSGTPLSEAIKRFNTHNRTRLVIEEAKVGELEVSGIFYADHADAFVRLLESSFSLRAERRSEHEIVLRTAN